MQKTLKSVVVILMLVVISALVMIPDDPNQEPELGFIENDDEYEAVAEAFDEYLDSCEFDEILEDE